ncbi:unnamed protein product [Mytilus edulis]|uniref:Uncharacterized protein n=1 Tax=Mytilus edulis TaxID=6550 RepID=A0A8S3QLU7_MYTED|nr:unnamed protein product [Mytilus edulis]
MMRHVRNKHSKTIVECRYCSYKVSSSLAFRMKEHEKARHAEQVKAAEKKTKHNNEKPRSNPTLVIPVSPMKRAPLIQKFEKSPEKCTSMMNFSPIKSPVPITLGYDDESLPQLPENLMALFESPVRPISPLPTTPKKRKIETPKTTEKAKSKKEEEKLSEERNRHLILPKKDDLKDEKKRFMAPPSLYQTSEDAARVLCIREKARRSSQMYSGSVIPDGIGGVKKVEKAILPDGTVYELSAYWMPDPTCSKSFRPPSPPIEEKPLPIYVAEPVKDVTESVENGEYTETTVVVIEGSDTEEETTEEDVIQVPETSEKETQTETTTKDMATQSGEMKIMFELM